MMVPTPDEESEKMIREIVRIDENKCDGCGLCVPACAEGAIRIIDGKARLLADNLCDGLGACLGHCPQDAILIEKREADTFDEEAVHAHLHHQEEADVSRVNHASEHKGCPSAKVMNISSSGGGCPSAQVRQVVLSEAESGSAERRPSELRQWPVQMHLVPPSAPFLQKADLLLAADCVPFAYPEFHRDLLRGKALLIGCPKLDDGQAYLQKLTAILQKNEIRSLTVAHMEVPCCSGLIAIARQAVSASGKDLPLQTVRIGVQGDVK